MYNIKHNAPDLYFVCSVLFLKAALISIPDANSGKAVELWTGSCLCRDKERARSEALHIPVVTFVTRDGVWALQSWPAKGPCL